MGSRLGNPIRSPAAVVLTGTAGVALITFLDYWTGNEISFTIFYFIPISFVAWFAAAPGGMWTALLSGFGWFLADFLTGSGYSRTEIAVWNALMRFMIFALVAWLVVQARARREADRAARLAALRAAQEKSDFLANVSHEIRTPLNAMIGAAEILLERTTGEERKLLEIFRTESEHLRRLVNDILDFSKLEAGRLQLNEAPFDLRNLLGGIESVLSARVREKGLSFESEIDADAPLYWQGDVHRVRQILLNLLGNAIKFTDEGRVTVRASSGTGASSSLRFIVTDTGRGIPAERLARLFDRFNPSSHGNDEGAGLGLSISKSLAERMGGGIQCRSDLGRGTELVVELPLRVAPAESLPETGPEEEAGGVSERAAPLRMLIAEDYAANRLVLGHFFNSAQFAVEFAENGKLAVERRKSSDFDLILMDVHMPEMDGLTAAKAIRRWEKEEHFPPIPIIGLSASALQDDIAECLAAGCNSFVGKPVRKKELLLAIREVMRSACAESPNKPAPNDREARLRKELAALIPQFKSEMKTAALEIEASMNAKAWEAIPSIAHKISGAGGTYGFQEISDAAADVSQHAKLAEREPLRRAVERLNQLIDSIPA